MKINDYMNGRNEGMAYALKIAKEQGVEALEKECEFRRVTNIPSQVSTKACNIAIEKIKLNTIDTIQILSIATLADEFGFGKKRLNRFYRGVNCLFKMMVDGGLYGKKSTPDDCINLMRNKYGIDLDGK